MAEFYVVENGFLVSHGFAQDGCEALQARANGGAWVRARVCAGSGAVCWGQVGD